MKSFNNICDVKTSVENRQREIDRCKIKLTKLKEDWRLMLKNNPNFKKKKLEIKTLENHIEDMESRNDFIKSIHNF